MPAMWSPEVVVDEELARALIGDLVPGLRDAPLWLLGEGWDSTVWRAGDEWVFRFPRREVVVPGFMREVEVLPHLATALPLPVPVAELRGEPDDRVVCHGDLHLRHLLVSEAGDLAGVIDWIDVCRADACLDLLLYWGYLDEAGREAFLAEYGPVGDVRLLRARVITVSIWGALAEYADAVGMEQLGREAVAGLDRATADLD